MSIVVATAEDAEIISRIISESNKDVAEEFGLTIVNNPKHPSFCTKAWVLSDFERGGEYFMYENRGVGVGCVAFESPSPDVAYLNRLSVLPKHRHNGIGEKLVNHIVRYSEAKNIQKVSIGIIAEHIKLRDWYLKLGFAEGELKSFPHLPFDVRYMSFQI